MAHARVLRWRSRLPPGCVGEHLDGCPCGDAMNCDLCFRPSRPCGPWVGTLGCQPGAFYGRDLQTRGSGFAGSSTTPPRRTTMAVTTAPSTDATLIRPFRVEISDTEIEDLRARIASS